jgi:hypothetical protein
VAAGGDPGSQPLRDQSTPARHDRGKDLRGLVKSLLKKKRDATASWEPGKVSEMIYEFARPLREAEPGGPPDVPTLRNIMQIVTICWNQPVYEVARHPIGTEGRKTLDEALRIMPKPIGDLIRQLVRDRTTRFRGVPFLVLVRVEGETLADARIVAEARQAPPPVTQTN